MLPPVVRPSRIPASSQRRGFNWFIVCFQWTFPNEGFSHYLFSRFRGFFNWKLRSSSTDSDFFYLWRRRIVNDVEELCDHSLLRVHFPGIYFFIGINGCLDEVKLGVFCFNEG